MKRILRFSVLLICSCFVQSGEAKIFRNAYVSFELPEKWQCKIEGTEWVCSSNYKQQAREAIIILSAKEAGPSDNLAAYENHMKQSRLLPSRKGSPTQSKVLHVKTKRIGQQNWVDGMHKGSEIPNYYTRYLATVKDRVAILVTFSAHVEHYTKYSSDFFRAIQSLRVTASKDLVNRQDLAPVNPNSEKFGVSTGDIPINLGEDFPTERSTPSGGGAAKTFGLLMILAAGGLYFYLRKKRGAGNKKALQKKK